MNIRYPIYEGVYRILTLILEFLFSSSWQKNLKLYILYFHYQSSMPTNFPLLLNFKE